MKDHYGAKAFYPLIPLNLLQEARGEYLEQDRSTTLDWESITYNES